MHCLAVVLLCAVVAAVSAHPQATPLDSVNVDQLLGNKRLVTRQIKCVLNQAPCDSTGKQLKEVLPEVIVRNCRACNGRQLANARKITNFIQRNYPRDWQAIQARYSSG